MKFVIAKPVAKMSAGDLFYSAPRKSEIDKACDELFQICLRRADREFPRHSDYPERNGMVPQVEKRVADDSEQQACVCFACDARNCIAFQGGPVSRFSTK